MSDGLDGVSTAVLGAVVVSSVAYSAVSTCNRHPLEIVNDLSRKYGFTETWHRRRVYDFRVSYNSLYGIEDNESSAIASGVGIGIS